MWSRARDLAQERRRARAVLPARWREWVSRSSLGAELGLHSGTQREGLGRRIATPRHNDSNLGESRPRQSGPPDSYHIRLRVDVRAQYGLADVADVTVAWPSRNIATNPTGARHDGALSSSVYRSVPGASDTLSPTAAPGYTRGFPGSSGCCHTPLTPAATLT